MFQVAQEVRELFALRISISVIRSMELMGYQVTGNVQLSINAPFAKFVLVPNLHLGTSRHVTSRLTGGILSIWHPIPATRADSGSFYTSDKRATPDVVMSTHYRYLPDDFTEVSIPS